MGRKKKQNKTQHCYHRHYNTKLEAWVIRPPQTQPSRDLGTETVHPSPLLHIHGESESSSALLAVGANARSIVLLFCMFWQGHEETQSPGNQGAQHAAWLITREKAHMAWWWNAREHRRRNTGLAVNRTKGQVRGRRSPPLNRLLPVFPETRSLAQLLSLLC